VIGGTLTASFMETRQEIIRQYAAYVISEINPFCFSVTYRLIKNGKKWGTFHYIRKGNDATTVTHKGFSTRAKADTAIEANETRLMSATEVNHA